MKRVIKYLVSIILCFGFFLLAFRLYDVYLSDTVQDITKDVIEKYKQYGSKIDSNSKEKLEDSGITGSDLTFNTLNYPYYGLLSNNQKFIYKQVYANMTKFEKYFIPVKEIQYTEFEDVFTAIFNDHPELFYVNTEYAYKYYENGVVAQVELSYNDLKDNYSNIKREIDKIVSGIIETSNYFNTLLEKEIYVHNTLIDMIEYDEDSKYNQSIYSALILKKSVCAGYARSFQYIMNIIGIPTYYVEGTSDIEHAWNLVLLDNQFYNVDLTWDDSDRRYQYFNKTDMEFSKTHERVGLSDKLPNAFGTKYKVNEYGSLIR